MRPWIRSLSNILPKRPLRDDFLTFEMSKNMFPGIFFGFDRCNPKLFAFKNRSSIVPSLQDIQIIQFLMILMSKNVIFEKCRKSILTGATIRKKSNWFQWWYPFWLKPSKMTSFWRFSILSFFIFLHFLYFWGRRHEALVFKSAPCPAGTPVRVGSVAVFLKCAEKLMFG